MLPVDISENTIRIGERFAFSLYRTLRVPDDGKTYPLPPGLGTFPLFRVDDYRDRLPPEIRQQGGAFVPMYQREALWLGFHGARWKPNAVIVAAGGINVLSGKADSEHLSDNPQNYLVCPDQPWLDGIHTDQGSIRQFVAMPLGLGYTVEAALAGAETRGGIKLTVFEPKPGRFPDSPPPERNDGPVRLSGLGRGDRLGLGAGGVIRQKIYPDPYGLDTWDPNNFGEVIVHLVNSARFHEITGIAPPDTPVDAKAYTDHGLPWLALYDEAKGDIPPADEFLKVKTISARDAELEAATGGEHPFDVPESQIRTIPPDTPDSDDTASKKR
jgi:hypothetical protein